MIASKLLQTKNDDQLDKVQVDHARYIDGYKLAIVFTDGKESVVDFSDFLSKYANGYISKYKNLANFKKFKIERGNIVWGRDWDLIFPVHQLYNGKIKTSY